MKRKDYDKPAMRVVELQQYGMLMASQTKRVALDVVYQVEEW